MIEELVLVVGILALLAVHDLRVMWFRVKLIGAIAIAVSILAILSEVYVIPLTKRVSPIHEDDMWYVLIGLSALLVVLILWITYQNRRKSRGKKPFSGDPGDYKLGR